MTEIKSLNENIYSSMLLLFNPVSILKGKIMPVKFKENCNSEILMKASTYIVVTKFVGEKIKLD